jgi:hypothetical protein
MKTANAQNNENIMTETIIIHLPVPVNLGTTQKQIKVNISPTNLSKIAKYLNAPGRPCNSGNQLVAVHNSYYTLSQYDKWGDLQAVKKEALAVVLGWLNVETVQIALSGALTLPDEIIASAVTKAEEYTEKKEQESKAATAARIEKQRVEAEKKKQAELAAAKLEAEKVAARVILADELAKMQKNIDYWRDKAERTETEITDNLLNEIIEYGYIERNEDVEIRYSVERED